MGNTKTSDANHQVLLEGLTSLNRAFPVLLGMSLVFFFEGFIFALCATMREDIAFLWRPWPINAILPRFNERHSASAEFKTDLSFATYFGQNDEPLFSQFNQYIVDYLVYYILLTATVLFVFGMEWMGTYIHADHLGYMLGPGEVSKAKNVSVASKLVHALPHLGDAAFVVFVTAALYFPSSTFGYLLFCFGITKLMYPEITVQMWAAFVGPWTYHYKKDGAEVFATFMAIRFRDKLRSKVEARNARESGVVEINVRDRRYMENATKLARSASADENIRNETNLHLMHRMQFTPASICSLIAGTGLLLHHTSMIIVFCASSLHIYDEALHPLIFFKRVQALTLRKMGIGLVLVFVLVQHIIIEIFFQWFAISAISEVETTVDCVGILGLMLSHYMMSIGILAFLFPTNGFKLPKSRPPPSAVKFARTDMDRSIKSL